MKNEKGITLISLIITIVLLIIIAGTTIYTSYDRFKINNLKKMNNDIELLNDKISTYYVEYGGIPTLELYTYTSIVFTTNVNDDETYYIIDLSAIGNITLNYGEEGYKSPNTSDDVYIVNNKTHTVYYVKGVEYTDGVIYHSLVTEDSENSDNIPPTKPQINIVSGDQDTTNENATEDNLYYTSDVVLEFVSGKDNWSGVKKNTYTIIKNEIAGDETDITTLSNRQYTIDTDGEYKITLKSYDNKDNYSETTLTININKAESE